MNDVIIKYSKLNRTAKQEVNDFIDFLLSKQKTAESQSTSKYKEKILNVSTWSDEDIKVFDENVQLFHQWKAPEW